MIQCVAGEKFLVIQQKKLIGERVYCKNFLFLFFTKFAAPKIQCPGHMPPLPPLIYAPGTLKDVANICTKRMMMVFAAAKKPTTRWRCTVCLKCKQGDIFVYSVNTYIFLTQLANLSSLGSHQSLLLYFSYFNILDQEEQQKISDENVLLLTHCALQQQQPSINQLLRGKKVLETFLRILKAM